MADLQQVLRLASRLELSWFDAGAGVSKPARAVVENRRRGIWASRIHPVALLQGNPRLAWQEDALAVMVGCHEDGFVVAAAIDVPVLRCTAQNGKNQNSVNPGGCRLNYFRPGRIF